MKGILGVLMSLLLVPFALGWRGATASEIEVELISPQEEGIKIRPVPEATTSLAVIRYAPKAGSTPETETALKVFNDVLWADLKFCALFRLPGQSFLPAEPIGHPDAIKFEDFTRPEMSAEFVTF